MKRFGPKNNDVISVGRGATAIFLSLSVLDRPRTKVIVPGNLCYTAIFPVLYAKMQPVFCDVDKKSGNVTIENVSHIYDEEVSAMIIPHMYGNPVVDMNEISGFCKERGVWLIQDCASAMGISPIGYDVHNVADVTIYSMGYSKTINLGFGGLLEIRDSDIFKYIKLEQELHQRPADAEIIESFIARIYRLLRNTNGKESAVVREIFDKFPMILRNYLIYSIAGGDKEKIYNALDKLPFIIEERRLKYNLYDSELEEVDYVEKYYFGEGAVPWRYNLFVEPCKHKKFIEACLEANVPISDWYPSVLPVFGYQANLPGVIWHENRIVNLPLMVEDTEIKRICMTINKILKNLR